MPSPIPRLPHLAVCRRVRWAAAACAIVAVASTAPGAQSQPAPGSTTGDVPVVTSAGGGGIPVTSEAVRAACGPCHASDAQQRLTRISYRRTTPEGWELTIKRMVALNGLRLEPAQARAIVKYLSDRHGLAPDEAAPAAFDLERRQVDHRYAADRSTADTCTKCHSMGRVIAERRTKDEWGLLIATHQGYYPLVDMQAFRRMGPRPSEPAADAAPPDTRHPSDRAVAHLSTAFPLETKEWAAWSATVRSPRIEGRWAISGDEPGAGRFFGEATIAAVPDAPDTFTTRLRYTYARSGRTVERQGRGLVYTGYQWRGRSTAVGTPGPAPRDGDLREVLWIDRGWRAITGRWFTGAYQELGMDVVLRRLDQAPQLIGTSAAALQSGGRRALRLFGANLPSGLAPADIDLGPGLTVAAIETATPDVLTLQVEVARDAAAGPRDVFVRGLPLTAAFVVFDRIDAVKVRPQAGMARVGGARMPKQLQQFDAVGYHRGVDGKPGTGDDLELGLVEATWSLEEYAATLADDDRAFVGAIDGTGLFTPNLDGPNPKRRGERNNIGDVWVVASVASVDAAGAPRTLRGRAHLLVTVPLYLDWTRPLEGVPAPGAAPRPSDAARP